MIGRIGHNQYQGPYDKPLPNWQMDLGVVVLGILLSPLLVFNLLPRRR